MNHTNSITALRSLKSNWKFVKGSKGRDLKLQITIENTESGSQLRANALLDSGATGSCINREFVKKNHLTVRTLPIKMPVYNADGTLNADGSIEGFTEVRMIVGDHAERIELAVTNLGSTDIFLGLDWLRFHNPSIDWTESLITFDRCPDKCGYNPWWTNPEEPSFNHLKEEERLFIFDWEGYIHNHGHLRAVNTETITEAYVTKHPAVFNKHGFDELPERRPWDHAIELTPGAKPVDCKVYPLSRLEQKALDEFLEENLRSGRIRPSSSPMASPFFFVKKKDGTHLEKTPIARDSMKLPEALQVAWRSIGTLGIPETLETCPKF